MELELELESNVFYKSKKSLNISMYLSHMNPK
jgi:hypothetical protein